MPPMHFLPYLKKVQRNTVSHHESLQITLTRYSFFLRITTEPMARFGWNFAGANICTNCEIGADIGTCKFSAKSDHWFSSYSLQITGPNQREVGHYGGRECTWLIWKFWFWIRGTWAWLIWTRLWRCHPRPRWRWPPRPDSTCLSATPHGVRPRSSPAASSWRWPVEASPRRMSQRTPR